jgi:hypothetical protein
MAPISAQTVTARLAIAQTWFVSQQFQLLGPVSRARLRPGRYRLMMHALGEGGPINLRATADATPTRAICFRDDADDCGSRQRSIGNDHSLQERLNSGTRSLCAA